MKPIKHVAIIMDGNGRWGLKKKNYRNYGHSEGLKTLKIIVNHSIKKEIKHLTLYTFSTDNWKRPKKEINYLFSLLNKFLTSSIQDFHRKNIRIKFLGNKKKLDNFTISKIVNTEKLTRSNTGLNINIALNYGSKEEIINSFNQLKKRKLSFTQKNIEKNLYTKDIPDPDIMIRTGNTQRLSNFMLWQLSYTELFFVKKLWPDFNIKDFDKILKDFNNIKRKFGSINE